MDARLQDAFLLCARDNVLRLNEREITMNAWSLHSIYSLIDIFADEEKFDNLTDTELSSLLVEMNNRVAKSFNIPASFVTLERMSDANQVCIGKTYANSDITIMYIPKEDRSRLSNMQREWAGLECLNTILHESRHAYQNYMTAKYFKGGSVSTKMAGIAQDNFIEMALCVANIDYDNNYEYSIREKDAIAFAYDLLKKYANVSQFEDRIKKYINLECATKLADNQTKYDIVLEQLESHAKNLNQFSKYFFTDKAAYYMRCFNTLDVDKLRGVLRNDVSKHQQDLKEYILERIAYYESTDNTYTDTLKGYLEDGDLYKCYYGVLYIDKQEEKQKEGMLYETFKR